jgi:hypothetical protein
LKQCARANLRETRMNKPLLSVTGAVKRFGGVRRCAASISTFTQARSTHCWARMEPASRR